MLRSFAQASLAPHQGWSGCGRGPVHPQVCLLRWSNVHSWYADKDLSYSISVQ